jgi:predicted transposase/invertase (TIGR01784 family)
MKPSNDFVFKLSFGDVRNLDLLTSFLQSTLPLPAEEYEKVTIVDPHLLREFKDDKLGIMDVKITTTSGKIINVEIQLEPVPYLRGRTIFYDAKMITGQIGDAGDYLAIQKVISIVITDFVLIPENDAYHNCYTLSDPNTGSQFTDLIEIHTLELAKLPEVADGSELWDWLRFLRIKQEEELEMVTNMIENPTIQRAVGVIRELNKDERARLLYEAREKQLLDVRTQIVSAEQNKAIAIAGNLLRMNLPIDDIVKATGLTRKEIEAIRKDD